MKRALSIIELVVALLILGVVAAIALPRMSRGSSQTTEARLRQHLAVLRNAIEMYRHDHGVYPGQRAAGPHAPAGSPEAVILQLMHPTDREGVPQFMPVAEDRSRMKDGNIHEPASGGELSHSSSPADGAAGPANSNLYHFADNKQHYTDGAPCIENRHFGPYLREGLPACPVAEACEGIVVVRGNVLPAAQPGSRACWVYNVDTGYIVANSSRSDTSAVRYDRY